MNRRRAVSLYIFITFTWYHTFGPMPKKILEDHAIDATTVTIETSRELQVKPSRRPRPDVGGRVAIAAGDERRHPLSRDARVAPAVEAVARVDI